VYVLKIISKKMKQSTVIKKQNVRVLLYNNTVKCLKKFNRPKVTYVKYIINKMLSSFLNKYFL